jgi:polyhydroxyalkanoate synthesis regulator phasin
MAVIKASEVKKIIKETNGKRTSKDFINRLDHLVTELVKKAALEHNGGKKTVDEGVANLLWGNK